jgi:hypothetical protein
MVFVGIESPDPKTLVHTRKKQNTRRNLVESVHCIYRAGMFVTAGFIVGFDGEEVSIADAEAREQFWQTLVTCAKANAAALRYIVILMAFYLHLGPFVQRVIGAIDKRLAELELEEPAGAIDHDEHLLAPVALR